MKWLGHELPEWAKWIARDADGEVWAFDRAPMLLDYVWENRAEGGVARIIAVESNSPVDWRDSLVDLSKLREQPTVSDPVAVRASDRQVAGTHYKEMGIQTWDVVDTWPRDQRIGYYRGNALKYVMRMGSKDAEAQEIEKGIHYLEKLVEVLKEEKA